MEIYHKISDENYLIAIVDKGKSLIDGEEIESIFFKECKWRNSHNGNNHIVDSYGEAKKILHSGNLFSTSIKEFKSTFVESSNLEIKRFISKDGNSITNKVIF